MICAANLLEFLVTEFRWIARLLETFRSSLVKDTQGLLSTELHWNDHLNSLHWTLQHDERDCDIVDNKICELIIHCRGFVNGRNHFDLNQNICHVFYCCKSVVPNWISNCSMLLAASPTGSLAGRIWLRVPDGAGSESLLAITWCGVFDRYDAASTRCLIGRISSPGDIVFLIDCQTQAEHFDFNNSNGLDWFVEFSVNKNSPGPFTAHRVVTDRKLPSNGR